MRNGVKGTFLKKRGNRSLKSGWVMNFAMIFRSFGQKTKDAEAPFESINFWGQLKETAENLLHSSDALLGVTLIEENAEDCAEYLDKNAHNLIEGGFFLLDGGESSSEAKNVSAETVGNIESGACGEGLVGNVGYNLSALGAVAVPADKFVSVRSVEVRKSNGSAGLHNLVVSGNHVVAAGDVGLALKFSGVEVINRSVGKSADSKIKENNGLVI